MNEWANQTTLLRAFAWVVIAVTAYLAITHVIATAMVLTMWGPDHPEVLYSDAYLVEFLLLIVRIILSIAIVAVVGARRKAWNIIAILMASALLAIEILFLFLGKIPWFSNDPRDINVILEGSALRGVVLSAIVIGSVLINHFSSQKR